MLEAKDKAVGVDGRRGPRAGSSGHRGMDIIGRI